MRRVIAVDIDGTLCEEVCWTEEQCASATPIHKAIDVVNGLFETDFVVILTARKDHLISATLVWLKRHNVHFHAISNFKMPFDLYIDSDAVHPEDV